MSIQKIDAHVSSINEVPLRSEETNETSYRTKVENFLRAIKTFSSELTTLISQLNIFKNQVNNARDEIVAEKNTIESYKNTTENYKNQTESYMNITKGVANYQGDYDSSKTYNIGQSVSYQNTIYISKIDNNQTSPVAGESSSEWLYTPKTWTYKNINADYTVNPSEFLNIDTTSNEVSITLPSSPNENDRVGFLDVKGNFETNKIVVLRNGNKIMGKEDDMEVTKNNISFVLKYNSGDWRII